VEVRGFAVVAAGFAVAAAAFAAAGFRGGGFRGGGFRGVVSRPRLRLGYGGVRLLFRYRWAG